MIVGLIGGSFDPLHLGHLALASALRYRREPDALWLLPVAAHPFGKVLSPFEHRMAMARIGAELLGFGAQAHATEAELVGHGSDGTTVSLLRHLTTVHSNDRFLLALGADAYNERDAWREFDAVAELAEVVVFNRFGSPEVSGGGPPLAGISSREVRAHVHRGDPIDTLVPAAIDRYIRAHQLYR